MPVVLSSFYVTSIFVVHLVNPANHGVQRELHVAHIAMDMESITIALQRGETVALPGFGTFTVTHREERQGRNLQTGEPMTIPAHNIPSFKPGKGLRDAVR